MDGHNQSEIYFFDKVPLVAKSEIECFAMISKHFDVRASSFMSLILSIALLIRKRFVPLMRNDLANPRQTPRLPYTEGPISLSQSTRNKWIYPIDEKYPERKYQLEISHSCIMKNTLVSLPTGLGKTLIAAVVMYNYYRWFPSGKIVCKSRAF